MAHGVAGSGINIVRSGPVNSVFIASGILKLKFKVITFFLDGSIWEQSIADDTGFNPDELEQLANLVTFDCKFREAEVQSPIGPLRFDWIGSHDSGFGGASWYAQEQLVNAGIYMFGSNPSKERKLLHQYLTTWRGNEITQQLRPDGNAFSECLDITDRPLMVSLNSGALPPDAYDRIASYDFYLASLFFNGLESE